MFTKFQNILLLFGILFQLSANANTDPLPSWNDGPTKKAILEFVKVTTTKNNSNYVVPEQRFATFDQDGTLLVEQPIYSEIIFAFDRIGELAPIHPEWKNQEPFKSIITHNKAAIAKFTKHDLEKIMIVTSAGMTPEDFQDSVNAWINKANNPRWNQPYIKLIYQPMLEVMNLLQTHGYKNYIVSGSGQDFIRAYSVSVYHIPAEHVIGSALKIQYRYDKQGHGILIRTPQLLLNNDHAGKPQDINLFIGRHPQAAFGNSAGDQQMLEYTQAGKGAHLIMLVHHDDAVREYAYGENSKVGAFPSTLMSEANQRGWLVISMKKDWKRIFSFSK